MKSFPDLQNTRVMNRRAFLGGSLSACAIAPHVGPMHFQIAGSINRTLTKEERDAMSPSFVIDQLKKGNARFRSGKMLSRDYIAQQKTSAEGQYPAAVVLGCIDSRVPAETVFDVGIGALFVARVAGNIVNDDLLGSMEYGCAVSGAKAVVVLGHTGCGAIKGAVDDVVLGNLTGLLARIKPAMRATKADGEKSSKNHAYVDTVAKMNVDLTLAEIRRRSPVLEELEKKGNIAIVGAFYELESGTVDFLPA